MPILAAWAMVVHAGVRRVPGGWLPASGESPDTHYSRPGQAACHACPHPIWPTASGAGGQTGMGVGTQASSGQAVAEGEGGGLGPPAHRELAVQAVDVALDGAH